MPRNPTWEREELILALDLYVDYRGRLPGIGSEPVVGLSRSLNRLASVLGLVAGDERFRNEAGVYRKLGNFLNLDPDYPGAGLAHGGQRDKKVWHEFAGDRNKLRRAAASVRQQVELSEGRARGPLDDEDSDEFPEGRLAYYRHSRRERNRTARRRKMEQALRREGLLQCQVCGFNFESTYGEIGRGFIECHHLIAVGDWPEGERGTRLSDLALVCSNCHRILHRRRPWPSVGELRTTLVARGSSQPASAHPAP